MVVVDSSALIPLARIGRLDLVATQFDEIRTTEDVRNEVLIEGKPGTARLESFLDEIEISTRPEDASEVARLEGLSTTDASVILLAEGTNDVVLANDRALIDVARTHGVDSWWPTTLLLACAKDDTLSADAATEVLYDLVDAGMNLHPKVYARVQKKLRELGE